ncbi:hypothetical protein BJX64DRAFT_54424 [Aspergillus heterothallicus]
MRFSAVISLLVAARGVVGAVSVVEVDLVFPRNDTYAPTKYFPIMFAFQNAEKAELLNPRLSYIIMPWDEFDYEWPRFSPDQDLARVNWSRNDPYLAYQWEPGWKPGRWLLVWTVDWQSCNPDSLASGYSDKALSRHTFTQSRMFTIANSTSPPNKEVDLVAATADTSCVGDFNAVAINVTDETLSSPKYYNWGDRDTCAVTTNSTTATPAHSLNPCAVSLSPAMAASVSANLTFVKCRNLDVPDDIVCLEDDESTAQRLTAFALSGLLAAAGASVFITLRLWSLT